VEGDAAPAAAKTLPELKAEHQVPPRGRTMAPATEESEQSAYRNYVRDLVLGLNDGIVSVYALVAGLVGAGFGARSVAVAGIAASVAGALSMGLGEYVSTKSQAQYYASEARREREHIRTYPDLERQELAEMLEQQGYPEHLRQPLIDHIISSEERFVEFMMREEFGVGKESGRSPFSAMLLVMAAFLVGAALAVVPFAFGDDTRTLLYAASALALAGLFAGGAAKGYVSGLPPFRSGFEMAALGTVAAVLTYGVGTLIPGA
jgi:vacuolar iron transporter family protein